MSHWTILKKILNLKITASNIVLIDTESSRNATNMSIKGKLYCAFFENFIWSYSLFLKNHIIRAMATEILDLPVQ